MLYLIYAGCNGCFMVSETLNYPLDIPLGRFSKSGWFGRIYPTSWASPPSCNLSSIPKVTFTHCFACTAFMHLNSGLNGRRELGEGMGAGCMLGAGTNSGPRNLLIWCIPRRWALAHWRMVGMATIRKCLRRCRKGLHFGLVRLRCQPLGSRPYTRMWSCPYGRGRLTSGSPSTPSPSHPGKSSRRVSLYLSRGARSKLRRARPCLPVILGMASLR